MGRKGMVDMPWATSYKLDRLQAIGYYKIKRKEKYGTRSIRWIKRQQR